MSLSSEGPCFSPHSYVGAEA